MFVERLQFYRFPVNSDNAVGTVQEGLILETDDDAPFRLSGIAVWTNDVSGGAFDGQLSIRFQRPDGRLVQRLITPTSAIASGNSYGGSAGGNPNQALITPVNPNIIYPPRSVITIDTQTLSGAPVTPGTIIVFVGVKIFKEEEVWAPKYPRRFTARPYLENLTIQNVTIAALPLLNQIFTAQQDADFVWQAGVYTDFAAGSTPVAFQTESGSLTVQANGGAPGDITIQFVTAIGPNQPTTVSVIGHAITVTMSTDALGGLNALTGAMVTAINANAGASALVTAVLTSNGSFQPFPVTPIPAGSASSHVCQLLDLGVIVRDWRLKSYMNDYIPVALLFPYLTAQQPGWTYPEIYLPTKEQLSFDLNYLWPGFTPAVEPITVMLGLKGMKVYGAPETISRQGVGV